MKNKVLVSIVLAIVLIGSVSAFFVMQGDDDSDKSTTSQPSSNNQPATDNQIDESSSDLAGPITLAQVELHNNANDCWTIIDGSVYDITSYVPRHPGGDEILRACGADGTSLFTERMTTDGEKVGTGTPHSGNATSQLSSLKIGELGQ